MSNDKIIIGGVSFNKADIKSSEKIQKDGKTLNSVFLNDGTHVVFPNQSEGNQSTISQKNLVTSQPTIGYGLSWQNDYEIGPYIKQEDIEHPDKKVTTFERLSGAEITGTDAEDRYYLKGCNNTTVDVSQNDGKTDRVDVYKSTIRSESLFGDSTTFSTYDNEVKLGQDDVASTRNKNKDSFWDPTYKQTKGPATAND